MQKNGFSGQDRMEEGRGLTHPKPEPQPHPTLGDPGPAQTPRCTLPSLTRWLSSQPLTRHLRLHTHLSTEHPLTLTSPITHSPSLLTEHSPLSRTPAHKSQTFTVTFPSPSYPPPAWLTPTCTFTHSGNTSLQQHTHLHTLTLPHDVLTLTHST